MIVVGIDPGLHGGIVALRNDTVIEAFAADHPDHGYVRRGEVVAGELYDRMMCIKRQALTLGVPFRVVIEEQHTRPMEGRVGAFNCGKNWGKLLGVCHEFAVIEVTPPVWSRAILGAPPKGGWRDSAEKKDAAIALVRTRLPSLSLTWGQKRKPHDGLADAACLAMWGQSQ